MGWRGKDGTEHLRGAPNPKQWEMYAKNNCVFQYHLPESMHYMRNWNREYLDFAKDKGWRQKNDVVQLALYCDTLQTFRLAAQGKTQGRQPPEHLRERIETYFDPLPFWYPPLEDAATDTERLSAQRDHAAADGDVPLVGLAERLAAPDPQPQLPAREPAHRRSAPASPTAAGAGSRAQWGSVRCMVRYSEAVEPGTVWTWNAIGKADGAWQLAPGADESRKGFLLNHLISDELPHRQPPRSATPIRSPARPAGTTCACASGRPSRSTTRRPRRRSRRRRRRPACAAPRLAPSPISPRGRSHDRLAEGPAARRGVASAPAAGRAAAPARPGPGRAGDSRVVDPATIGKPGGPSETLAKQLALVIDLNVCVGCHACVTSCKEWNTSGSAGPLVDENAYGANPTGTFFNRVQTFEAGSFPDTDTIHFPKSCLHCEEPPCVPVCPTGASYKRKEDGIVLVDYDKCIGCKYCAWACPYGAREIDEERQVMTKCTLCVDRIYDESMAPQRPPAGLRQGVPDRSAPVRRREGSRLGGVARDPRARRLLADAGVGHQAGQPVPAAARRPARPAARRSNAAISASRGERR